MLSHLRTLLRDQRIGFLAVGAVNTAVGYLIYSALTIWVFGHVPFGYLYSLIVSYALAIVMAFVLYRRFVFRVTGHVIRDFVRFMSVYLVAIGTNALALPLLVEVLRVPPLIAQAIILVLTTALSFFGHKSFSFRRSPAPDNGGAGDQPTTPS